ncbi:MAG: AraC family transcriptional regulator [Deltaproteobacteria bacterium]|nr:AraC family transcriptional regulator [Deltaproteobacteria bacterium]
MITLEPAMFLRPLLRATERLGLDPGPFVGNDALVRAIQINPFQPVSPAIQQAVQQKLFQHAGGSHLVLETGRAMTPADMGLMGNAMASMPNARVGIELAEMFIQRANYHIRPSTRKDGNVYRCRLDALHVSADDLPLSFEYIVASNLAYFASLGLKDGSPLEVRFQHGPLAEASFYANLFQCPVKFHQPVNEVLFPASLIEQTSPQSNPTLSSELLGQLERLLPAHPPTSMAHTVLDLLRQEDSNHLSRDVKWVSGRLGVSVRTLQYRLKEEATTFHDLQDSLRREQAGSMLAETKLPLEVVAERTGFQDPTSFHRAFIRWYGTTPLRYRRVNQTGSSV